MEIFSCKMDSVKLLVDVLKSLQENNKNQHAILSISSEVIRFTVHDKSKNLEVIII